MSGWRDPKPEDKRPIRMASDTPFPHQSRSSGSYLTIGLLVLGLFAAGLTGISLFQHSTALQVQELRLNDQERELSKLQNMREPDRSEFMELAKEVRELKTNLSAIRESQAATPVANYAELTSRLTDLETKIKALTEKLELLENRFQSND